MSVLVTSRISGEGGFSAYTRYLERPKAAGRERNCGFYSDLGATPAEAIAAAEAIMRGTSRKNWGQSVVHSYADDELAPTEENAALAMAAAAETCRRACPGAPVLQWAQRDGKGGKLHVHTIVLNHDFRSGKAARGAWSHWQWRKVNDQVMTGWRHAGLQVCTPGRAAGSSLERTTAARSAAPSEPSETAEPSAEELREAVLALSRDAATQWLGEQIDRCADSGALEPLSALGSPAELEVPLECGLTLSVWVKSPGKSGKPTVTYAVLDDTGGPVSTRTGGTGKPIPLRRTQSQLDKALVPGGVDSPTRRYAYEALMERISPAPGGLGTGVGIEVDTEGFTGAYQGIVTLARAARAPVAAPVPQEPVEEPGEERFTAVVLTEPEEPEDRPQEPAEERFTAVVVSEPEPEPGVAAQEPDSAQLSAWDRMLRKHGVVAPNKPGGGQPTGECQYGG